MRQLNRIAARGQILRLLSGTGRTSVQLARRRCLTYLVTNSSVHSLIHRVNLVQYRGYSALLFHKREDVVLRLYDASSAAVMLQQVDKLQELGRPVALHFFRSKDLRLVSWLRQGGMGRLLFQDDDFIVWYLESESSP